jgi:endonuclease/exonuclease/phosphatase family metal-dependent hydrolase
VLGDFNEWTRGLATTLLTQELASVDLFTHLKRRKTYPGVLPVLHLDHIYYQGARVEVRNVELPRTRRALIASDHLPLVADLRIRF